MSRPTLGRNLDTLMPEAQAADLAFCTFRDGCGTIATWEGLDGVPICRRHALEADRQYLDRHNDRQRRNRAARRS